MSPTLAVFVKECRESLRDKRVLLNALVLGPLLAPVLFVGLLRFTIGRQLEQADKPLPVVVIGAERAPELVTALKQQGMEPLPALADIETAVREQRVALALRITDSFAEDWRAGRPAQIDIIYDSSQREAGGQVQRLRAMLQNYSWRTGAMRLIARGLVPTSANGLLIAARDQATPQARGALLFAMLPYFLILSSFLGGMWLAIDSTAGERERLSLEPLLINPVPRAQILLGKLCAAAAFSFISLTLGLAAFALAARLLPSRQFEMSLNLEPRVIGTILLLMLPLVFLIVISQMVVAAFARSYREAQTYVGLLQLLPLIPSVALSVAPVTPQLWMYGLPLIGQQLTVLRLLRGEAVTALQPALCSLATLLAAIAAFLVARRIYESERLAVNA
ncbi:MAG TPA: ABC transporter permease [Steroidobacteraceae bacterium]|jgi:sodium transport system permease protein|nr:ABC transporter permease [Steroidobacteraceae bacterium]